MQKLKKKLEDGSITVPGLLLRAVLLWFILSFVVFPNVNLIVSVFFKDGRFTTEAIHKIMQSTRAVKSLKNSFILACASVITVNITGILIVLFTEYFDIKGAKLLKMGFMTTLIYGGVVLVTGYKFVYGETGIVTNLLMHFFPGMNREWFIGFGAVLFIMTFSATSNHMMFLTSALKSIDYHTIEAARNMSASQSTILFKIVLPTLKPTIFAITILTFLSALSTMSGPLIVGGPDFQTINPMIKTFSNMMNSRDIAALLSIILGVATTVLLVIMQKVEKRGNYVSVSKTRARLEKQKINNPVMNVIAHIVAYTMFVIYMLPILNVLVFSFCDGLTIKTGVLRPDSFTLANYQRLFSSPSAYMPYVTSTVYALVASLLVAVVAVAATRLVTKAANRFDKIFEPLSLIPWLLPATMIALGLMMTYDVPRWNIGSKVLVATPVIMLIAYVIIKIPFSYRMVRAGFVGLDGNLEEAGRVMGAKPFYIMRKVILPVLSPVVLSVIVMNFIALLSEYDLSVFLYYPTYRPLSIEIMLATDETATMDAQAMSFVYTVVLMILSSFALWLGKFGGIQSISRACRRLGNKMRGSR